LVNITVWAAVGAGTLGVVDQVADAVVPIRAAEAATREIAKRVMR
jgi:hypothetical protein